MGDPNDLRRFVVAQHRLRECARVLTDLRERAAPEVFGAVDAQKLQSSMTLDAVYRARTQGELRALRADLPALPPAPTQARAELAERRSRLRRQVIQQTGGGLGLFVLCTAIWAASGAQGSFWPIWVAFVALIPLLRNGWRLYGPAPELDRRRSRSGSRPRRACGTVAT